MNYPLTIQLRRDTRQEWDRENPILRQKELVAVLDENDVKFKLGDGKSKFSELPYVSLEYGLQRGFIYMVSGEFPVVRVRYSNTILSFEDDWRSTIDDKS